MTKTTSASASAAAVPTLAEALAQRAAAQKLLWSGVLAPLRSVLSQLDAVDLRAIAQEVQAILPYLPEGQNRMALTNLANILPAAPQAIRDALALAERESV